MEQPLLKDPGIYPEKEVLSAALSGSYIAFELLMNAIADVKYALSPEWRYYKDGNVWLCKVSFKKKTIFWLSVWDGFFKTGFYFTEKYIQDILDLDIDKSIKDNFNSSKLIGKLKPLTICIHQKSQIKDILTIVEFKKNIK